MIGAFDKIAQRGLGDPTLLSKDIGEALITTFAGLAVGIPAMFFFYFFRNYLSKVTTSVEDIINRLLEDVPFSELQGVKIGPALEEELQGAAAPPFTRPAVPVGPQPTRPAVGVATVGSPLTAVMPAGASAAPSKPVGVSMVNCPNCRALILPNSRVCPNCRAELEWN
jgi:biopolymer transport protein ExbB